MADLGALAEARAVLDLATGLLRRVEAEVRAAEEARRRAEDSLEAVLAAGEASCEHVAFLGAELRQGGRQQLAALDALATAAAAGRGFWEAALPDLQAPPALAASAYLAVAGPRTFVPDPSSVTAPDPETLRRVPLPSRFQSEVWDLFDREVGTFQEIYAATMAALDQAEEVAAERRQGPERRPQEAPGEREKQRS